MKVATFTSGVVALGIPKVSRPAMSRAVFSMHPRTMERIPSLPRYSRTAKAPATGPPGRVPVRVYTFRTVRYGVATERGASILSSLTRRAPAGIGDIPILWGSTEMEETPGREKSKGKGFSRNGMTRPPKAASTWRKTPRSMAISERARMGSTIPYSVVPAIPTRQMVFRSICSSACPGSILKFPSRGTVRIPMERMSQAFSKEKWADSGTTTLGSLTPARPRAIRRTWRLDSVPPEVAYPQASLWWRRSPSRLMRSRSIPAVPGKRPGSPRFVPAKRASASRATGWGRVHMEERILPYSRSSSLFRVRKEKSSSRLHPFSRMHPSRRLEDHPLLCAGHPVPDLRHGVDVGREARDPVLDEPLSHLGVGARLAADGTFHAVPPADPDGIVDDLEYRGMLGPVHAGDVLIVPVDSDGVLDQVIRAKGGEPDPRPDEVLDEDGARGDLHHDPEGDVLHVHPPPPHHLLGEDELVGVGNHGKHHPQVRVARLPETFEGLDLEPELVGALEVPADPPPPEHRVVLVGFVLSARHVPELVGGGIEGPDPDRLPREGIEDDPDPARQLADELLLLPVPDVPHGGLVQAEDEVLDPEEPHPVRPGRGGPGGRLGEGDVHLHRGGGNEGGRRDGRHGLLLRRRNPDLSLVDEALLPVDGHHLAGTEDRGGLLRPDDRGGPELPGDDGRVAGHPAFVGDDGRDLAHRRDHVRVRHFCDEDVPLLHVPGVLDVPDDGDPARSDPGRGPLPLEEDLPGGRRGRLFLDRGLYGGDGPGLEDEKLPSHDGPLEVLGYPVVVLRDLPEFREPLHLAVGEHGGLLLVRGDFHGLRPLFPFGNDHLELLGEQPVHDLLGPVVVDVLVWRARSRDHRLPETPGPLDDGEGLAGDRVGGEHDAGLLGRHEFLDHHGDVHAPVIEALLRPVVDGPRPVEGGPALLDRPDEIPVPLDVQVGLLLAREGGVRQVLGRGARADRDDRFAPEGPVGLADLLLEVLGDGDREDELACLRGGPLESRVVLDIQVGKPRKEPVLDAGLLEEPPEGLGRHHEGPGNREADAEHLAEGCPLSSHRGDVLLLDLFQGQDVRDLLHGIVPHVTGSDTRLCSLQIKDDCYTREGCRFRGPEEPSGTPNRPPVLPSPLHRQAPAFAPGVLFGKLK